MSTASFTNNYSLKKRQAEALAETLSSAAVLSVNVKLSAEMHQQSAPDIQQRFIDELEKKYANN